MEETKKTSKQTNNELGSIGGRPPCIVWPSVAALIHLYEKTLTPFVLKTSVAALLPLYDILRIFNYSFHFLLLFYVNNKEPAVPVKYLLVQLFL